MKTPILDVDSLDVRYGNRHAIRRVSFRLGIGVTGLLGPNGAGKSSLLRSVATAQRPAAGSVRIGGLEATEPRYHRAVRRRIGYLPQTPGFYPSFTVQNFVGHIAILKEVGGRRSRRDEVNRVLTAVGLGDRRALRSSTIWWKTQCRHEHLISPFIRS